MSDRERLQQASGLIREKRYAEARDLLKTIDHPTAREWLGRIDEIMIASRAPSGRWADKVEQRQTARVDAEDVVLHQPPRTPVDLPRRAQSPPRRKLGLRTRLAGSLLAFVLLAIVVVVVVGVIFLSQNGGGTSVPAAPTDMARYFPSDTLIYAAIRTDDTHIDSIDAIIQRVTDNLPMEMIVPLGMNLSVRGIINQGLGMLALGDFETSIRPWLGDWAAVGVYDVAFDLTAITQPEPAIAAAVHIRNRDEAAIFIGRIFGSPIQTETQGGYQIYRTQSNDLQILLGEDVMYLANEPATGVILNGVGSSLYDDTTFQQTFARLPESDYGLVAYINGSALMDITNRMVYATLSEAFPEQPLTVNSTSAANMAYGLAIRDGNTILLDTVQEVDSATLALLPDFGSIDPAFMAYVPSNTVFVMHSTNLRVIAESYMAMFESLNEIEPDMFTQFNQAMAQIDSALMTVGGFTLQEGVLDWLTGDYAIFLAYDPALPDVPVGVSSIQGGLVIEATNPVRARAVVDAFANGAEMLRLEQQGVSYRRETIAGVDAVVFSLSDGIQTVETVVGSNDSIFIMGTRAAAERALNGSGGLYTTPDYTLAQSYYSDFSGDRIVTMYLDGDVFTLAGDLSGGNLSSRNSFQQIQSFYDFARIFRFWTVSAIISDEGVLIMRGVLRLSD